MCGLYTPANVNRHHCASNAGGGGGGGGGNERATLADPESTEQRAAFLEGIYTSRLHAHGHH